MSPIRNAASIFAKIPEKEVIPGETLVYDTSHTIDLDDTDLLKDGEVVVKSLAVSIDPYIRARMRDASIKSYMEAIKLGEPYVPTSA